MSTSFTKCISCNNIVKNKYMCRGCICGTCEDDPYVIIHRGQIDKMYGITIKDLIQNNATCTGK